MARVLGDAGHDVDWVGGRTPQHSDDEILSEATQNGRVIVTLDRDFGELVVLRGQRHTGIIRLVDLPLSHQAEWCLAAIRDHQHELTAGALPPLAQDVCAFGQTADSDRAMQTLGGFGYSKEYHVERYWREAKLFRITPVTPELILSYIAERVLGLPKSY